MWVTLLRGLRLRANLRKCPRVTLAMPSQSLTIVVDLYSWFHAHARFPTGETQPVLRSPAATPLMVS